MAKETYICTTCGHVGLPDRVTKGSFLIELALWLFFIVPGLIYSIWRLTTKHDACPMCGNSSMIPSGTPRGIELTKTFKKSSTPKPVSPEKDKQKKKGSKFKAFVVFVLIPLVFILVALLIDDTNQSEESNSSVAEKEAVEETIIDTNTSYVSKTTNGVTTHAVLFKIPLERDDYIVGKEIGRVIGYIYGTNMIKDATPKLVERNGVGLISMEARDGRIFLILLMKDENGTVWGMDIWKE